MIDVYEIGIQLALQDDVSAGLDVIKSGLAEVDRAIDATSAKLVNLTATEIKAGVATSGAMVRPATGSAGRDEERSPEQGAAVKTQVDGPATASVSIQAAAAPVPPQTEAINTSTPSAAPSVVSEESKSTPILQADDVTPPSIAPVLDPMSPTTVHVHHSVESAVPASPVQSASEVDRANGRVTATLERSVQTLVVPNAPSIAPERAQGGSSVREDRSFTASIAQASAPSRANQTSASMAMRPSRSGEPLSETGGRAAAPWSGIENRVLSPRPAAASERAVAPQARQEDKSDGSTGTVILDGHLVGYWLAEQMAKEASRPPSGTSFFDPRQTPAWTASGSL